MHSVSNRRPESSRRLAKGDLSRCLRTAQLVGMFSMGHLLSCGLQHGSSAVLRLCKIRQLVLTLVIMLFHASAMLPSILSAVTEAMAYGSLIDWIQYTFPRTLVGRAW